ncbi:hypothetical protein GYMLUDRAFT_518684 [Collybiopsis luxurians FD-317 M1]|nr:hypothetical protein GYMLUDRAFT_518684 [Collybiopsis luxurians FD-317 M1]
MASTTRGGFSSSRSRKRAVQACQTCRKSKARCELLDDLQTAEILRCHRCKALGLSCSYQDANREILGRKTGVSTWEQLVDFADVQPLAQNSHPSTNPTLDTMAANSVLSGAKLSSIPAQAHPTALEFKVLPQSIWKYRVSEGQWRYFGSGTDNDGYDWSTPMSAVRQISSRCHFQTYGSPRSVPSSTRGSAVEALEDILERNQIDELLRIFQRNYLPWLGFSLIHSEGFPMLDLVCCTIASRSLPTPVLSLVSDRLLRVTEHAISQIILYPSPAYVLESIQMLIMVALWAPISTAHSNQPEDGGRDPHLLLSSAISLATRVRLNDAPERYSMLRKSREQGVEVDESVFEHAADLAKLWIFLSTVESLYCIGTARTAFSQRRQAHLKCFPRSTSRSDTSQLSNKSEARDVRLRLLAETLNAAEMGLATRLTSVDGFEPWHRTMMESLQKIDGCVRILLPLGVVLDFDQMYFRAQTVISRCCRLLVLYHAFHTARLLTVHDKGKTRSQSHSNIYTEVFTPWGKDALLLSEEIFVAFLELLELLDRNRNVNPSASTPSLSSAPDYLFQLIEFVGIFLVSFKFMVFNAQKHELPGSSDALLERVVQHLRRLDVSQEHPAKKCAGLLSGLLELWSNREQVLSSPLTQQQPRSELHQDGKLGPISGGSFGQEVEHGHGQSSREKGDTGLTPTSHSPVTISTTEFVQGPRLQSNLGSSESSSSSVDLSTLSGVGVDISMDYGTFNPVANDITLSTPISGMSMYINRMEGSISRQEVPITSDPAMNMHVDSSADTASDSDIDGWSNSASFQDVEFWRNIFSSHSGSQIE